MRDREDLMLDPRWIPPKNIRIFYNNFPWEFKEKINVIWWHWIVKKEIWKKNTIEIKKMEDVVSLSVSITKSYIIEKNSKFLGQNQS